jgi:hypothetical protein
MSTYARTCGYVRPLKRLLEGVQYAALADAGADPIYVESKDETLADAILQLQPGDTIAVFRLHVLAPPKKTTVDRPRDAIWDAVDQIKAKKAIIFEVDTGRKSTTDDALRAMIRDAIDMLTSGGRAAAGRENGKKSRGRDPIPFTDAEVEQARNAWFSRQHRTNDDAVRASPKHWTRARSFEKFGPSGR